MIQHDAVAVVHKGWQDRVGEVLDTVLKDGRYQHRHELSVFETDILQL